MGLLDGTWGAIAAPDSDVVDVNSILDPYKSGSGVNLEGLHPGFQNGLNDALSNMPADLRSTVKISSGFRPPEQQRQIVARFLRRRGLPVTQETLSRGLPGTAAGVVFDANGNLVGSKSRHAQGAAVDIEGSPEAMSWLYANSARYGFENPFSLRRSDPVHFQLVSGAVPDRLSAALLNGGVVSQGDTSGGGGTIQIQQQDLDNQKLADALLAAGNRDAKTANSPIAALGALAQSASGAWQKSQPLQAAPDSGGFWKFLGF